MEECVFYGKLPTIQDTSFLDYPSKDGLCLTIMFTGCEHNCYECHNRDLQGLGDVYGSLSMEGLLNIIDEITKRLKTNKIVLQGGDPLHPQNREFTYKLLNRLHVHGYTTCVYTGYEYEEIKDFVKSAKYVKCGKFDKSRFIASEKTDAYFQLSSTNQKLYMQGRLVSTNGRYTFE